MRAMIYKMITCVAIIIIVSTVCNAQMSRSGQWELGGSLLFLDGETIKVADDRAATIVEVEEDDWNMYGINLGYNIDEHWNINTVAVYGDIDADIVGLSPGTSVDGEQTTVLWMFNLDYNILAGPLTPYVSGGLGYGYSNTEVEYTIGASTTKLDEDVAGLAYSFGVGGRWDFADDMFVKVEYRQVWDDEGDDRSGIGISAGFRFE